MIFLQVLGALLAFEGLKCIAPKLPSVVLNWGDRHTLVRYDGREGPKHFKYERWYGIQVASKRFPTSSRLFFGIKQPIGGG